MIFDSINQFLDQRRKFGTNGYPLPQQYLEFDKGLLGLNDFYNGVQFSVDQVTKLDSFRFNENKESD